MAGKREDLRERFLKLMSTPGYQRMKPKVIQKIAEREGLKPSSVRRYLRLIETGQRGIGKKWEERLKKYFKPPVPEEAKRQAWLREESARRYAEEANLFFEETGREGLRAGYYYDFETDQYVNYVISDGDENEQFPEEYGEFF